MKNTSSFFSINVHMLREGLVAFDIYVNASSLKNVDNYVKILPAGEEINRVDIDKYKKYPSIFVNESQRNDYIKYLVVSNEVGDVEKTQFLKDSAVVYMSKLFDPQKEFSTELLSETVNQCKEAVESMIDVIGSYNIDTLKELIASLSFHDFYTFDHSINVSMYCMIILKALRPKVKREELLHIGLGGLLHDLGKVKIPTEILNASRKLTADEYKIIKTHPGVGITLFLQEECEVSADINKEVIARIIHEHHENVDGSGYPKQLTGPEIHIYAKICTIADFFDAITTKRSYSQCLSVEEALDLMDKTKGIKIDADLFEFFRNHISHKKLVDGKYKLSDEFDPAVCYKKLPLEEFEQALEKKPKNYNILEGHYRSKKKSSG